MKRGLVSLLLCMGGIILMSSLCLADNIGHVDMQFIFRNLDEAKDAEKQLQEKQDEYEKLATEKQKVLAEKREQGNKEEIEKYKKEIEEELKPKQMELLRLQSELSRPIQMRIIAALKKVAPEYNIDVVLDRSVVLDGSFDLTEYVLTELKKDQKE